MSILVEMWENLDFGRNLQQILFLDEIFENLDFGRNCWKILILVEIFGNLEFWSKFAKKNV